jgi:hypothetical protein
VTGRKTSVYLSEEAATMLDADSRSLARVIADGLSIRQLPGADRGRLTDAAGEPFWYAEEDEDAGDPVYRWRPVLQLNGYCAVLEGQWYMRDQCEQFIRDQVMTAKFQPSPVADSVTPAPAPVRTVGQLLDLAEAGDVEFAPSPVVQQPEPQLGHRRIKLGSDEKPLPPDPPLPTGHDMLRAEAEGRRL